MAIWVVMHNSTLHQRKRKGVTIPQRKKGESNKYLEHIAHNWLYPRIIWMLEDTISEPCTALIVCRNLWKQDRREKDKLRGSWHQPVQSSMTNFVLFQRLWKIQCWRILAYLQCGHQLYARTRGHGLWRGLEPRTRMNLPWLWEDECRIASGAASWSQ